MIAMATNFATANYQEVIDLHTESDTVSVIGIHTPNSDTPVKMLRGFWEQFRKFKYNGCSISLVPAARLPADPLQVSYEAGETTIDPRDMLNPILFHGCHGDDMGTILNALYSGSTYSTDLARKFGSSVEQNVFSESQVGNDYVDALYYKALTDRTWLKAHPQSGFRRSGLRPLVHRVVANMGYSQFAPWMGQDPTYGTSNPGMAPIARDPPENPQLVGQLGARFTGIAGATTTTGITTPGDPSPMESGSTTVTIGRTMTGQAFMTSRMEPLGWQDTHSVHMLTGETAPSATGLNGNAVNDAQKIGEMLTTYALNPLNTVPKVFMGMIMLPPAYKTEQYFRLVINHNFAFKGFRGASMDNHTVEMVNNAPAVFNFN